MKKYIFYSELNDFRKFLVYNVETRFKRFIDRRNGIPSLKSKINGSYTDEKIKMVFFEGRNHIFKIFGEIIYKCKNENEIDAILNVKYGIGTLVFFVFGLIILVVNIISTIKILPQCFIPGVNWANMMKNIGFRLLLMVLFGIIIKYFINLYREYSNLIEKYVDKKFKKFLN